MALKDIDTFVVVILENRSFDHMLGYLSLSIANPPMAVEGLRDDPTWQSAHANPYGGEFYPVHQILPAVQEIDDPPHELATIAQQIELAPKSGSADKMGGFVESYMKRNPPPKDRSLAMAYYSKDAIPVFDFFARNFVVCDHWFASLPSGTQANRLMAMG